MQDRLSIRHAGAGPSGRDVVALAGRLPDEHARDVLPGLQFSAAPPSAGRATPRAPPSVRDEEFAARLRGPARSPLLPLRDESVDAFQIALQWSAPGGQPWRPAQLPVPCAPRPGRLEILVDMLPAGAAPARYRAVPPACSELEYRRPPGKR